MSDTPTPQSQSGFRTVASEPLERFTTGLIAGLGADHDIAAEVARHLVLANLSGHDSHGVIRLPQYVQQVDSGALVPTARPGIILDGGAVTVFHAGRGFGQYSLSVGMDHALKRAREYGIAAVALRQCMHIGRLGDYAERAAAAGMITIVTVGSAGPGSGPVAAHGDHHRLLGTNPWCFGVPGGTQPFVFDAATSALAEGKVRVAKSKGAEVPPGVLVDTEGNPTNTPQDLYDGGAILPFGGDVARHKGYGLALASGLLGGLAAIGDPNPTMLGGLNTGPGADRRTGGVLLLALDPAAFGTPGQHGAKVAEVLSAITGTDLPAEASAAAAAADAAQMTGWPDGAERADGEGVADGLAEGALIPGTPEARSRKHRAATGIPIPTATWNELTALGTRLDVPLP